MKNVALEKEWIPQTDRVTLWSSFNGVLRLDSLYQSNSYTCREVSYVYN